MRTDGEERKAYHASHHPCADASRPSRDDHGGKRRNRHLRRNGCLCEPLRPAAARARARTRRSFRRADGKQCPLPAGGVGIAARGHDDGADLHQADRARDRLYPQGCRREVSAYQHALCRSDRRHPQRMSGLAAADRRRRRRRGLRGGTRRAAVRTDRRSGTGAVYALFLGHHRPAQGGEARTAGGRRHPRDQSAGRPGGDGRGHACRW